MIDSITPYIIIIIIIIESIIKRIACSQAHTHKRIFIHTHTHIAFLFFFFFFASTIHFSFLFFFLFFFSFGEYYLKYLLISNFLSFHFSISEKKRKKNHYKHIRSIIFFLLLATFFLFPVVFLNNTPGRDFLLIENAFCLKSLFPQNSVIVVEPPL